MKDFEWFAKECGALARSALEAGYEFSVKEIETLVLIGYATRAELAGFIEGRDAIMGIAKRNLEAT
tara:strand:- start:6047 stop:6244 length:198 start_codon:yes stop_codon:yes gene_type:complete